MKRFTFIICALILTLAGSVYAKGKPGGGGTCADVPISWEFLGDGSGLEAILSDGSGIYMDGNGVSNSRIHSAGTCAGDFGHSKDATMAFSSPRSLRFKIDGEIPGSLISGQGGPAQYGPTPFPTNGQLNIRNIVGFGAITPGQPATYYTKASGTFFAPDGKKFVWASMPDDFSCPFPSTCAPNFTVSSNPSADVNSPVQTGWVKVTYTPAVPGASPDTWNVEGLFQDITIPTVLQRVTLHNEPNANKPSVHYGQYSLPFRIIIRALAPLP